MKTNLAYAVLGAGVLIMGGIAWWFGSRTPEPEPVPEAVTPSIEVSEGISIYTNGEHGFLMTYPDGAEVTDTFASDHLPGYWRMTALPDVTGTPLVAITTYRVENESSYPRFYETVVRVGVSDDAHEVRECLSARTDQGERALPIASRIIDGTEWQAFSFGDAGMMKYVKGVSFRTVKDGACYALEEIASGSSYRDDPASATDIPDTKLDEEFDRLSEITKSFRFAR